MNTVRYDRKTYTFSRGIFALTRVSVTEKPTSGEDEKAFTDRLLTKYSSEEGTMEVVIKDGQPDYAIINIIS